jgi:hypothetical protein
MPAPTGSATHAPSGDADHDERDRVLVSPEAWNAMEAHDTQSASNTTRPGRNLTRAMVVYWEGSGEERQAFEERRELSARLSIQARA